MLQNTSSKQAMVSVDSFFSESADEALVGTMLFVGLVPGSLSVALYTTEVCVAFGPPLWALQSFP